MNPTGVCTCVCIRVFFIVTSFIAERKMCFCPVVTLLTLVNYSQNKFKVRAVSFSLYGGV